MHASQPTLELLQDDTAYRTFVSAYGTPEREFFAHLSEALAQEARIDPARATCLADTLVERARETGSLLFAAYALRAQGNVAFLKGEYATAVDRYRGSRERFEECGEDLEMGRTLSSMVHPLAMLGDTQSSLEAADQARASFVRCNEPLRIARLDINLASVYFREDRFREALEALDSAEKALRASEDREAQAVILVSRAVILINIARFEEAETTYERARTFALEFNMPQLAAQADYNIGYLFFLRGQYVKAINMLDRARETAARYEDKLHLALCDYDQSDVCVDLNLYEDGLRLAHSALQQFQSLGMAYEAGKAMTNMAVAEQFLGHDNDALELLGRAQERFAHVKNEFWVHMANLYRAVVLLKMGRCFEALQLSEQARTFFEKRHARTKAIYAGIVAAKARAAAGDLAGAQTAARKAADGLIDIRAPWLRVQVEMLLGQLEERSGNRRGALDAYERAMQETEATRGNINFDELRISFMRDKTQLYERYLELLVDMDPAPAPEHVWRHMERAKSRSLALLLAGGFGSIQPRMGEGSRVVQEISRLREELNWYYRQLDPSKPEAEDRVEEILQTIHEHEHELLRALRQLPEGEYGLLEQQAGVTLERLREHLGEATLIEYFHCGDGFAAAVVDQKDVHVVRLPGQRARIESALRLFRFQVAKRAMESDYFQRFGPNFQKAAESHLRLLYQDLFAPLAAAIRHKRLLIVPHGVLHGLSFAALQSDSGPLAAEYAIAMAPSAAVFALCSQRASSPHSATLLVAAEPEAAAGEVRAVGACWPESQVLEGAASTLDAVKSMAATSRVIHIAAHGVFRADNPYFSALELADGRLNVIDIYNLRLQADLVVLSGCGTALGDLAGGDEIVGLTRAFLYAGARAVVASLWDVDDKTTAEFMTDFYRRLRSGSAAVQALRETQTSFREKYVHPFFWAPFQLVGSYAE